MRRETALWAGLAAFFGSLLAIGALDILNPGNALEYLGSLIVAVITAGAVYSKERLEGAKQKYGGNLVVTEIGDKKVFSLELEGDPELFEYEKEIVLKVQKGPSE